MHLPTAPLIPDRAHVIVIGGGIAGLAASLRLACAGLRVTLLERHAHLGGKIRTLPSDAGPVDAGPPASHAMCAARVSQFTGTPAQSLHVRHTPSSRLRRRRGAARRSRDAGAAEHSRAALLA